MSADPACLRPAADPQTTHSIQAESGCTSFEQKLPIGMKSLKFNFCVTTKHSLIGNIFLAQSNIIYSVKTLRLMCQSCV